MVRWLAADNPPLVGRINNNHSSSLLLIARSRMALCVFGSCRGFWKPDYWKIISDSTSKNGLFFRNLIF